MLDRGTEQVVAEAAAAVADPDDEAGDRPDLGVGAILTAALEVQPLRRQPVRGDARLDGDPADRLVVAVAQQPGRRCVRGGPALVAEQLLLDLVRAVVEAVPGELEPLAPAVRGIAGPAEDGRHVVPRRVVAGDGPEAAHSPEHEAPAHEHDHG